MHLFRFSRVSFGHINTQLEFRSNLSRILGGPDIYIKREDYTEFATGGNKIHKFGISHGRGYGVRGISNRVRTLCFYTRAALWRCSHTSLFLQSKE